jgi:hypothetical protein
MAKQDPIKSTLSDQEKSELGSKSMKDIGKSIGSDPDEWDIKNIQAWLDFYEKAYPGRIAAMKKDIEVELALSGRTKDYGEISKDSEMRLSMWLPAGLEEIFEIAYPSFWTNKEHLAWFLRHFPQFRGAPKH